MRESLNTSEGMTLESRIMRVGIIGAGYIADWHLDALKRISNVAVTAVCDISRSRAHRLAERFGVSSVYDDSTTLSESGEVDVVHVLVPPTWHQSVASTFLKAGIDVFLEKPACPTAEQCLELSELAKQHGRMVGVGHNFLFDPRYERLKSALHTGAVGRPRDSRIEWCRELGFLRSGPYGAWPIQEPGNVMLEIGPHSIGMLLDLFGEPDDFEVDVADPVDLPGGQTFFRRWDVRASFGTRANVFLTFDFSGAYGQHLVEVRGQCGVVQAELEAGLFVLKQLGSGMEDFERSRRHINAGRSIVRDSVVNAGQYVFGKLGLSPRGNTFGYSIQRCLTTFYGGLPEKQLDPRLSLGFAQDVMSLCNRIAKRGCDKRVGTAAAMPAQQSVAPIVNRAPDILVLGGTGFIGRVLVRQLVEEGHSVRVVARDPSRLPVEWQQLAVEPVAGDLRDKGSLEKALSGISTVYHLARASGTTWNDYLEGEVEPTVMLAKLAHTAAVERFIYTGTIDSYFAGDPRAPITDTTPLDPAIEKRNLYARCKAECEKRLRELHDIGELPLVIFRPGIVIGRGGPPFHLGVGNWAGDRVCELWGSGAHPLPFVLVEDVASALVSAASKDNVLGKTFTLVGDGVLSGREYAEFVGRASGTAVDIRPSTALRHFLMDVLKYIVKVAVRHPNRRVPSYRDWRSRYHDSPYRVTAAKDLLGWEPANSERLVQEGIDAAVRDWFR